jgi:hypothetical protein
MQPAWWNSRRSPRRGFAFLVLALLFLISFGLQLSGSAYQGERTNYGDETPHYLNSLVIREYIVHGLSENPIAFASRYYTSYPKIALLVWPPLFHATLGLFMTVAGLGESRALLFIALCSSLTAFVLYVLLRQQSRTWWVALMPALLLVLMPFNQQQNTTVMLEPMLALLTLLFAWQMSRFFERPDTRNAMLLGLLGAAGCLVKGNGLANLMAVPLAVLATGNWRMLKRKELYLFAGISAGLSAVPMAIATNWLKDNSALRALSPSSLFMDLSFYVLVAGALFGIVVSCCAILGLVLAMARLCVPGAGVGPERTRAACFISTGASVLLFHLVVSHAYPDPRYMYPALPCLLYFCPEIGDWIEGHTGWRFSMAAASALILVLFFAVDFRLVRVRPDGFREALAQVRAQAGSAPMRSLVFSNDTGEGAWTVAVADSDVGRQDVVIRASKLLTVSNWMGTQSQHLFSNSADIVTKIERLGIRFVTIDYTREMTGPVYQLLRQGIEQNPDRFELFSELPQDTTRNRHLRVYRVLHPADPPLEKLQFRLPYSSTIVGDRNFDQ